MTESSDRSSHVLYERTQFGTVSVLVVAAAIACGFVRGREAAGTTGGDDAVFYAVSVIAAVVGVAFGSLRVRVTRTHVEWRLPLGVFSGRLALTDVAAVRVVRPNVLAGYGWRVSRGATLVRVSGIAAVECVRTDGKRMLVGSPDASRVAAVIAAART